MYARDHIIKITATITLAVVMVAVVSNSFNALYNGCCKILEAAVENPANMHHITRKLLLTERVMPEDKIFCLYYKILFIIYMYIYYLFITGSHYNKRKVSYNTYIFFIFIIWQLYYKKFYIQNAKLHNFISLFFI